jgi:hypothetical protein
MPKDDGPTSTALKQNVGALADVCDLVRPLSDLYRFTNPACRQHVMLGVASAR